MTRPTNYHTMTPSERNAWDRQERGREDLEYNLEGERRSREAAQADAERLKRAAREHAAEAYQELMAARGEAADLRQALDALAATLGKVFPPDCWEVALAEVNERGDAAPVSVSLLCTAGELRKLWDCLQKARGQ